MASGGFRNYLSANPPWDWNTKCIQSLIDATSNNVSIGFVDGAGRAMPGFEQGKTWGVNRSTCLKLCNSNDIPLVGSRRVSGTPHRL